MLRQGGGQIEEKKIVKKERKKIKHKKLILINYFYTLFQTYFIYFNTI